jgi:hypothetical protein
MRAKPWPDSDERQHGWTAFHDAGHAVATLHGRAVPGCPVVLRCPSDGAWGRLVVIPKELGEPRTMPAALALLAGIAAELHPPPEPPLPKPSPERARGNLVAVGVTVALVVAVLFAMG